MSDLKPSYVWVVIEEEPKDTTYPYCVISAHSTEEAAKVAIDKHEALIRRARPGLRFYDENTDADLDIDVLIERVPLDQEEDD